MRNSLLSLLCVAALNGSVTHEEHTGPGLIGVRVSPTRGTVQRVYIGSPAYWAGVKPNFRLIYLKPEHGQAGEMAEAKFKKDKEILVIQIRRESKKKFYTGFSLTNKGVEEDGPSFKN